MHNELHRRFPAGRGGHLKRLAQVERTTTVGDVAGDDFSLTTPISFTVTVIAPPPEPTVIPTQKSSSVALTSPITSITSSSSTLAALPTSLSVSSSPPKVATTPALSSSSAEIAGATPASENSGKASKSKGMPAGNIAAIVVILVLASLFALSLVVIRKAYIIKRMRKRATWTGGIMSKPVSNTDYSFGSNFEKPRRIPVPVYNPGDLSPGSDFAQAQSQAIQQSLITPPPMSYNNLSPTTMTMTLSSPVSGSSTGWRPPSLQSKFATVQCTFIPSLPDELTISTGENLRVLGEYDDGWALCSNGNGEQGMVPLECLDRLELGLGAPDHRHSRRVSSLATAGRY